jgi:Lipocalin-like domain
MTAKSFVGTWKLIYWKAQDLDGKVVYPFGESPIGYITYTQDGYMFATIMTDKRSNVEVALEDLMKARQAFFKPWLLLVNIKKYLKATFRYFQASTNYVSYSGRYEIQTETVIHHVEVSLIPDWVGTDLKRTFELTGDRLLLVTPSFENSSQYLCWERV